jgi:hypothetical protein
MKNTALLRGYNSLGEALRGIMSHSDVFQFGEMAFAEFSFMTLWRYLQHLGYSWIFPLTHIVSLSPYVKLKTRNETNKIYL